MCINAWEDYQIKCQKGDNVKKGDLLAITEAMKMETKIFANCDGVVEDIYLNQGDKIETGDLLIKIA